MSAPTLEVMLAVYNNVEATRLTLDGYLRQTDSDFSIAIADDGSGPEIAELLTHYASKLRIRHLWHEDRGFRKARILNQAIATSRADYLLFSDNDCIPSRFFVADHKGHARRGSFVTGRRVDLGPEPTQELLNGIQQDPENFGWLASHALHRRLKRFEKALRPPEWLYRWWSSKSMGTLGANMAMWREDLLTINGFDEDFEGYGMEEVDLEHRLMNAGVERRSILGRGACFHLYHTPRAMTPENAALFAEKIKTSPIRARNGIVKSEN